MPPCIHESPLTGFGYRTAGRAGDGEAIPTFVQLKVGGDGVGVVHGDIGRGSLGIADGTHIASPFHKVVVFVRLSGKVDRRVSLP